MSDRIDELVLDGCAFVACPRPQDCDTCPLTQLATIAREAEAERDALDALLVEYEALLPHASRRLAQQRREDGTR